MSAHMSCQEVSYRFGGVSVENATSIFRFEDSQAENQAELFVVLLLQHNSEELNLHS
jgi:hypothetical protein